MISLRLLGLLHRPGVGRDPHDLLLEGSRLLEDLDRVLVALAHLLPVGAGYLGPPLHQPRLRQREHLAVEVVEGAGQVAADLDVLHLVFAHRHHRGVVGEDVGRHQDGIGEQAGVGRQAAGLLVFEGMAPLEQAHWRDGHQEPGELRHLRHVRLHEQDGPLRVEAQRHQVERRIPHEAPQHGWIADGRERMEVGDEVVGLGRGLVVASRLELDVLADRPEIVAPVKPAGRLNPREGPRRLRGLRW